MTQQEEIDQCLRAIFAVIAVNHYLKAGSDTHIALIRQYRITSETAQELIDATVRRYGAASLNQLLAKQQCTLLDLIRQPTSEILHIPEYELKPLSLRLANTAAIEAQLKHYHAHTTTEQDYAELGAALEEEDDALLERDSLDEAQPYFPNPNPLFDDGAR